jgi:hypothetical protein
MDSPVGRLLRVFPTSRPLFASEQLINISMDEPATLPGGKISNYLKLKE